MIARYHAPFSEGVGQTIAVARRLSECFLNRLIFKTVITLDMTTNDNCKCGNTPNIMKYVLFHVNLDPESLLSRCL